MTERRTDRLRGIPLALAPEALDYVGRDGQAERREGYAVAHGVARIAIDGGLGEAADWWAGAEVSYASIRSGIARAMAASDVRAIVLDVDSPGGMIPGLAETTAVIRAASQRKPVVAYVRGMACSAAYWLASAATEIVASPTGQAGCLGCIYVAVDWSAGDEKWGIKRYVVRSADTPEKNPDIGTDAWRASAQRSVDAVASVMLADIGAYRGLTVEQLVEQSERGATLPAHLALAAGLVDRIAGDADSWLSVGGPPPSSILLPRAGARPTPLMRAHTGGARMGYQTTADGLLIVPPDALAALEAQASRVTTLEAQVADAALRADKAEAQVSALAPLADRVQQLEAAAAARSKADLTAAIGAEVSRAIDARKLAPAQRVEWQARGERLGLDELRGILAGLPAQAPGAATGYGQVTSDAQPDAPRDQQDLAAIAHARIAADVTSGKPARQFGVVYREVCAQFPDAARIRGEGVLSFGKGA